MAARYSTELVKLLEFAKQRNVRVAVVKMRASVRFRALLPNEVAFDEAVTAAFANLGIGFCTFSAELEEPRFYCDTGHLNRAGVSELLARRLKAILIAPTD
ncbi:hypothetical protein ACVW1C_006647 [Bradyrhizobium sp. USDA 4011]